jgi:hypothetical protein
METSACKPRGELMSASKSCKQANRNVSLGRKLQHFEITTVDFDVDS